MVRKAILESLKKHLPDKRFTILIGARQVGKSTVVKQLASYLEESGESCFYLTLEDPTILKAINEHPENLFYFTLHPDELEQGKCLYIIIDEVQYANDPTNLLKLIYDKYAPQVKIIATGSSAFYINRDFKDSLAGRKKIIELYPLSFVEFLQFRGYESLLKEYSKMQKRSTYRSAKELFMRQLFEEYITYGGYPAVVLEKDLTLKKELLADLVNSYMKKDALESRLKEELKFFGLVKLLAHQCGDLVNQNKLASDLQTAVGTIDNYLYTLRKCFHIHLLPPKFGTIRKELTKMPKVYFHDLGIRNQICGVFDALDNRFDKGAILENYAFIRLRDIYGIDSLKFWRTADGNEVDFIIETKAQEGLAYEVKFSEKLFYPSKYKKFLEAYPAYPLQTIVFERSTYESNDVFLM